MSPDKRGPIKTVSLLNFANFFFFCFFPPFQLSNKNVKKTCFDHCLECAVQYHWSKYRTFGFDPVFVWVAGCPVWCGVVWCGVVWCGDWCGIWNWCRCLCTPAEAGREVSTGDFRLCWCGWRGWWWRCEASSCTSREDSSTFVVVHCKISV